MPNPIDAAIPATGTGQRGDVNTLLKARYAVVMNSVTELRGEDLSGHEMILLLTTGRLYKRDALSTATDDGVLVLKDAANNRFVRISDVVPTAFTSNGEGVPDSGTGSNTDTYVDLLTGDTYTKVAGAWQKDGSLASPSSAPVPLYLFGATMDGVADDSAALAAAATYCVATGRKYIDLGGKTVNITADVDMKGIGFSGMGAVLKMGASADFKNLGPVAGAVTHGETGVLMGRKYSPPKMPSSTTPCIVYGLDGKIYALGVGGPGITGILHEIAKGNQADGLPDDSENGNWDWWRRIATFAVDEAYVYKTAAPADETGTWVDYDITSSDFTEGDASVVEKIPMTIRRSTATGSTATVPVRTNPGEKLTLFFFGSGSSPPDVEISIDGNAQADLDIQQYAGDIYVAEFAVDSGDHTVVVTHPSGAAANLYFGGCQFQAVSGIVTPESDVNRLAVFTQSPTYDSAVGASDVVIKSATNDNWAFSHHGGQTERAAPQFSIDGRLVTITDGSLFIGGSLRVFQQTTGAWSSSSESADLTDLQMFTADRFWMRGVLENVDVVAHSVHLGAFTCSDAFDKALGSRGMITFDGSSRYYLGDDRSITLYEDGSGRAIDFSYDHTLDINSAYGGLNIKSASGNSQKVYTGPVMNTEQTLPDTIAFGMEIVFG